MLRRHCDDVGRDPDRIRVTTLYMGDALERGDLDGFAQEMAVYAALGVETMIVRPPATGLATWIETRVSPAVPRLAHLDHPAH